MEITNYPDFKNYTRLAEKYTQHGDYCFVLETEYPPTECMHCRSENIVFNGRRINKIRHVHWNKRRVGLSIKRRRYTCTNCYITSSENLPGINEHHRMTEDLIYHIGQEVFVHPFSYIANDLGIDASTVEEAFLTYARWVQKVQDEIPTPEEMGIDEIYVRGTYKTENGKKIYGKYYTVITDISNKRIMELLEGREKSVVMQYLAKLKDKQNIKRIAIDMHEPFRDAIKETKGLEHVEIINDLFHISNAVNKSVNDYKNLKAKKPKPRQGKAPAQNSKSKNIKHPKRVLMTRLQNMSSSKILKLNRIYRTDKDMANVFMLKEEFYDIFQLSRSSQEAKMKFDAWVDRVRVAKLIHVFEKLIKTMNNWKATAFNYCNHRLTSAYTEGGANREIKDIIRRGRGYKFETLRYIVLLSVRPIRSKYVFPD